MTKSLRFWSSVTVSLIGLAAYAAASQPDPKMIAAPTGLLAPTASDIDTSYLHYNYYGDRYRDPFLPLNGVSIANSDIERPPQLSALSLKGIVEDTRGRMALLTSGVDSFILKNGRLFDGRNRAVKGISGIIKPESVVLIGSDRTVRELRAKPAL